MTHTHSYSSHPTPASAPHEDLRRAVMTGAVDVVANSGLDALTLREVARRSGVPNTAPSRLFRNRDGLMAAVAEEGFLTLFATIDGAVATVPANDPLGRVSAAAVAWTAFASSHTAQYRMMMASNPLSAGAGSGLLRAAMLVFGRLVRFVEQGQAMGKFRPWPAQEQALVVWATLHGLALLLIDGQLEALGLSTTDANRLGALIADRVLQGLST